MRTGPKGLADEYAFVPRTPAQQRDLLEALEAAGTPRSVRHRIVEWLVWLGSQDGLVPRSADYRSDRARRDYRRWLAALGTPPWGGGYDGAAQQEGSFRGSSIGPAAA